MVKIEKQRPTEAEQHRDTPEGQLNKPLQPAARSFWREYDYLT
ncbi:MAG TPA: hypothetical protein VI585_20165 [Candidatus Binatia bacterium]